MMSLVLESGFECVCTISDNHPINRSFFKSLGNGELRHCVNNLCDQAKLLFLLIDPTHNFKNVYNIFQKRVCIEMPATDSFEPVCGNFSHVRDLYRREKSLGLRMAHKINERVLNPTSVNRTSVKLAASVFHASIINALKYFATHMEKPEWKNSAEFIELFHNLWKIVNVKTQSVGQRKMDPSRLPIASSDDERLLLLKSYEDLFMASSKRSDKKKLSNETLTALILMCQTMRDIVPYLLNSGFKYVLLGHLQSDPLEKRFGEYRQRSGSNYFLGIKQVIDTERKIKASPICFFTDSVKI